ncbi:hypothetical protein EUMA32_07160 [Eubacterium maltosivorans]|uniref:Ig-like domain-containing protein n=3 Tax=Eubacterium maltosivorans TaxID=2041044 RepID=UPI0029FEF96A|nr:Ig-like domain-containing protein [Eubacterium maltosivorans]WPK79311.1 hypothetical protein EUMA32_07160 [Eubacterium maltosivorans]
MKKFIHKFVPSLLCVCLLFAYSLQFAPTVKAAEFSPRTTAPNLRNDWPYNSSANPFELGSFGGNCTYYVWGRAYEILGEPLPSEPMYRDDNTYHFNSFRSDAKIFWWDNKELHDSGRGGFNYGQTPEVGAIAVWDGANGHVGIVEKVDGNKVITSNSSWSWLPFYMDTDYSDNMGSNFLGYIYLLDNADPEPEPTPEPPEPTVQPTPEPTAQPTPEPTVQPTPEPTAQPTPEPTVQPTPEPTAQPTPEPTVQPTPEPTAQPTPEPTVQPTPEPTPQPEKVETTADVDGTQVKVSADSKVLPDAELKVSSVSDEVKNKADQAVKNKLDPEAEILEILDIKAVDKTTNQEKQPEGGTVSVEMSLNEKYKDNGDIKIVHFDDSKDEVNVVDNAVADKDNKTVSFEASHFSYYAAVKVPKASVSVSGVNLKWDSLKLYPGDSTTLQATVSPENATNKNVLWTSSDDSIVSVDTDGKITAHKEGTATITVTTEDGNHFDTTLIEVKNQEPKAASVSNQTYNDGGSGDGNVIKKLAATVTGTNPDTSIRQAALMNGDVPAWMIPSIIGLFAGGGILIGVIALIKRKRSE